MKSTLFPSLKGPSSHSCVFCHITHIGYVFRSSVKFSFSAKSPFIFKHIQCRAYKCVFLHEGGDKNVYSSETMSLLKSFVQLKSQKQNRIRTDTYIRLCIDSLSSNTHIVKRYKKSQTCKSFPI